MAGITVIRSDVHGGSRGMSMRVYRIALALSLAANVLLITIIWAYLHFEGLLSIIETAIGILG